MALRTLLPERAAGQFARGGLALAQLMASLDTSMVNAALPQLADRFQVPFHRAQWIVLASLLAVTSFTVSAGRLGDIVGKRRLLIGAAGMFIVASLACATAASFSWLITARVALGMGVGTIVVLTIALAGDIGRGGGGQGRAMAQLAAMSAVGTTLGPLVASALGSLDPRAIFLVNALLGLVTVAGIARYVPRDEARDGQHPRFDIAGAVLLAIALAAYATAMTGGRHGWTAANVALLAASLSIATSLAIVENRAAAPLLTMALFRERALSTGFAASAIVAAVVMTTLIVGPFYLARGLGLSAAQVGLVLSAGPCAAALMAAFAGRLVERAGATQTSIAGLVAMALGALGLASQASTRGVRGYVVPLVVLTAGYAAFQTSNNTSVMAASGTARRGLVAGLLALSRNLGLITGASVMGAVFARATGTADLAAADAAAIATGMRTTMVVAAALVLLALAVTVGAARRSASAGAFRDVGPCCHTTTGSHFHRREPSAGGWNGLCRPEGVDSCRYCRRDCPQSAGKGRSPDADTSLVLSYNASSERDSKRLSACGTGPGRCP